MSIIQVFYLHTFSSRNCLWLWVHNSVISDRVCVLQSFSNASICWISAVTSCCLVGKTPDCSGIPPVVGNGGCRKLQQNTCVQIHACMQMKNACNNNSIVSWSRQEIEALHFPFSRSFSSISHSPVLHEQCLLWIPPPAHTHSNTVICTCPRIWITY